jgi:hypothetical protein
MLNLLNFSKINDIVNCLTLTMLGGFCSYTLLINTCVVNNFRAKMFGY